jgi:hypothetical protein
MPKQMFTPQGHLTRRMKRFLKRVVVENHHPETPLIHGIINRRAEIVAAWKYYAVGGRIDIHREGRDCDHTAYHSVYSIDVPISVVAWVRDEAEHRSWLDGPERVWFAAPSGLCETGKSIAIFSRPSFVQGDGWR